MVTKNNRIAVSVPKRKDAKLQFKNGIPEVSNKVELLVLDVMFDSDCGYFKGQKVCLDGDFAKHKYHVYRHDEVEFTLISKETVLGLIDPVPRPLTQAQIDEVLAAYDSYTKYGLDGLPIEAATEDSVPSKGYRAPTALPPSLVPGSGVSVDEAPIK